MSLTLACSCGAQFEVEDTFAGQAVVCPDCQAAVKAPTLNRSPLRTSGLALASVILSLVGAFTIVFTLLAVLLGLAALVNIRRQRERLAGSGYAVFGIVVGTAFTVLSFFLYTNMELLPVDGFLEAGVLSSQLDFTGEREVSRPLNKFAITRPTAKWGVAKPSLLLQMETECDLMLVNPNQHTYVEASSVEIGGQSVEEFVDAVIKSYKEADGPLHRKGWEPPMSGFKLRSRHVLPPADGLQVTELLLDLRIAGQEFTYVDRIIRADALDQVFRVRAWGPKRRFAQMEAEMRRALDSFRLLP